jgi:GR25 family glycosyltransferase involved in LPS biosynthesis
MLKDLFEEVYIINLDMFPERMERTVQELKKIGIVDFKRIAGVIYGEGEPGVERRIGCAISHRNVILDAKERGLKKILVLEDDIEFSNNFVERIRLIEDFLKKDDWEMFYFGGFIQELFGAETENINKAKRIFATHCYAANSCSYDLILENVDNILSERKRPIDVLFADNIHERGKTFIINPRVAFQYTGFSYICNEVKDYTPELRDIIKKDKY